MTYTIQEELSNDGSMVYSYYNNNVSIPLNSLYSPSKEIERFLKKIENCENQFFIFIGLGNGILLEKLIESKMFRNNVHYLFIEPFPEVRLADSYLQTISSHDEISYLNSESFTPLTFSAYLSKFIGISTNIQLHPNYSKTSDIRLKQCVQIIKDGIETKKIMDNTEKKFSSDWLIEPLLNLPYTKNSISIKDLKGKYAGEKAILAASGPSLKTQMHVIKDVHDSYHIFSVGSALRALLSNGIEPDFVTSVDASEINYSTHFKGLEFSGALIYETMSNSKIQKNHRGPSIVARSQDDYITSQYEDLYTFPYPSPSVAIFTLQVIEYLGFSEVYLIGQDLALLNGQYYAEGIKHHEGMYNLKTELMVENNLGEMTGTTLPLKIFLESMQNVIESFTHTMRIYNLSSHGAKIKGTEYIEAIERSNNSKKQKNIYSMKSEEKDNKIQIKDFIKDIKMLQKDVKKADSAVNSHLNKKYIDVNDMPGIVKQFRAVSKHRILEDVLMTKLTFEFNRVSNVFQTMKPRNRYTTKELMNMISELHNFYQIIIKYLENILSDERLEKYI
ncbi:DUF115 domain-containing protein [Sporosarcina sp. GW1-11]|uniref:motility associated factor glycosyltransferase family protein n=1 Tax=Sporosarcina sp. GW1-11 TaxID=2899126 RepID=UPI00294F8BE6|nr:6-hydroxymethylpterin diphosphokinase MptE-like protein [Sporosarcina sp. GW1-11]MDV6376987.1 DUF115 domain-containing protein [Sporosarcina sp. GW1-11]